MEFRTRLDANQVLKNSFIEAIKALRTSGVYDEVIADFLEIITDNVQAANQFQILNPVLATANTKQVIQLPDQTKKFIIRVRNNESNLKLYQNITTSEYMTISRGNSFEVSNVLANGPLDLVLEADKNNITLEILFWV